MLYFIGQCCFRVLIINSVKVTYFYSYVFKNKCFDAKQIISPK